VGGFIAGLTNAMGDPTLAQRGEQERQRRQQFSDTGRNQQIQQYMGIANNIQKHLALNLDPDTMQPIKGKEQQVQQMRTDLQKTNDLVKNLYNPQFQLPAGVDDLQKYLAMPDKQILTPEEQRKAALIQAGIEPKATAEKPILKLYKLSDGSMTWLDANNPETIPAGATAVGGTTQAPKVGSFGDFMRSAYGDNPTAEQYAQGRAAWAKSGAGTTVGTHTILVDQPDGSKKAFQVETTSRKSFPGAPALPSTRQDQAGTKTAEGKTPATPGEKKKGAEDLRKRQTSGDGVIRPGQTVGGKDKDLIDTKSSYQGAIDRTETMDQNLKNALQGDQQAMLSLVANHIGMTLGAQKGARITRAVWDEAVESTPWLSRVAAKWGPDGYLSGVTLAPEQMRQMVRLAHEKTETLRKHVERLQKEHGGGDEYIYAKDEKGKLYRAKKGTSLKPGWSLTDDPKQ
jgi:hypothetical protein